MRLCWFLFVVLAGAADIWVGVGGVVAFQVLAASPANQKVGPQVRNTDFGHDAIAIMAVTIVACTDDKNVEVCLEGLDGQATDNVGIFSSGSLSLAEFSSLRCWRTVKSKYSFRGASCPAEGNPERSLADCLYGLVDLCLLPQDRNLCKNAQFTPYGSCGQ
jgi:hypothetical protein